MTRRQFRAIAEAIRSLECSSEEKLQLVRVMCRVLAESNDRFDWRLFQKACGFDSEVRL